MLVISAGQALSGIGTAVALVYVKSGGTMMRSDVLTVAEASSDGCETVPWCAIAPICADAPTSTS